MSFKDFHDKLIPFFSELQIFRLNRYGEESARDAFGDSGTPNEGRCFVCCLLWDFMDSYEDAKKNISALIGDEFTIEQYNALASTMDVEW